MTHTCSPTILQSYQTGLIHKSLSHITYHICHISHISDWNYVEWSGQWLLQPRVDSNIDSGVSRCWGKCCLPSLALRHTEDLQLESEVPGSVHQILALSNDTPPPAETRQDMLTVLVPQPGLSHGNSSDHHCYSG